MAKIKTSELQGAALDWAVAKCESAAPTFRLHQHSKGATVYLSAGLQQNGIRLHPSTDWCQGGPIIGRERILFIDSAPSSSHGEGLIAYMMLPKNDKPFMYSQQFAMHGKTPLIAAMRCYVASKLGDSVEVPEELT